MSDQAPILPHVRVPTQQLSDQGSALPAALEDQDNFVRDLGTILGSGAGGFAGSGSDTPAPPVPPSPSAASRPPVVTVPWIKMHCHIEPDQTADDDYLKQLEMAARLHTENFLRYQIDDAVGENIKQAMLVLIAHWYRNREAILEGRWLVTPLAYQALLSAERDYPTYT
jgi:hypothetical protein